MIQYFYLGSFSLKTAHVSFQEKKLYKVYSAEPITIHNLKTVIEISILFFL